MCRRAALALGVAAIALALAACGGEAREPSIVPIAPAATPPGPTPTTTAAAAPQPTREVAVEVVADGLDFPASLAFAPDGTLFFSERLTGRIRLIQNGRLLPQPFAQIPIVAGAETGLLGLALHPSFPQEPFLYAYLTQQTPGGIFNRILRLRAQGGQVASVEVILDRIPAAAIHNGGILEFGPDGMLYASTGDAAQAQQAQELASLGGKVLRLRPDGSLPQDNPFANSPVFSLGHRNVFGLAFRPSSGALYATENGPSSDDELNLVLPGRNYGWPLVLGPAGDPRFIDPIRTYTPNIAPTEAHFYAGRRYPPPYWDNLFFGDWNSGSLHRLALGAEGEILLEETIIRGQYGPILDVTSGPDGLLYFSTPTAIVRITRLES